MFDKFVNCSSEFNHSCVLFLSVAFNHVSVEMSFYIELFETHFKVIFHWSILKYKVFSINFWSLLDDVQGILFPKIEHLLHVSTAHSEGIFPVVRKFSGRSNHISEIRFRVGKDSSCKSIHSSIISSNLYVSGEHLERVPLWSVFCDQFLVSGKDNIYCDVRLSIPLSFASVNSSKNINIPDCSSIHKWGIKDFSRREVTNNAQRGK